MSDPIEFVPGHMDDDALEVGWSRRRFLTTLAGVSAVALAPPLVWAGASSPLEREIFQLVAAMRKAGRVAPGERTSWSVYDFTTRKKLVAINEETPRQAASMIKPFVAQAYFFKVKEKGSGLGYSRRVRGIMESMIRYSNNGATNYLINKVSRHAGRRGAKDVEYVLKSHAPGIFQQTRIVEKIPSGGRTYRNKASAHDYSRFLYALWKDHLPYSRELKEIMALPNKDRIRYGVEEIPSEAVIYDKTGSTAQLCGDMGIVECPGRNGRRYAYTFIGIIERGNRASNYGRWISSRSDVLREVSATVYDFLKDRHKLV